MTEQLHDQDVNKFTKDLMNKPVEPFYKAAKQAVSEGKVRLVEERVVPPFDGAGFEIGKGQVVRYALTEGPQTIDCFYVVKKRPTEEWVCAFNTAFPSGLTYYEGDNYFSNTPYVRPLLTIITDTVDHEKMWRDVSPTCSHSFLYPSGRCNAGTLEAVFGLKNQNNCDSNMLKGIYEVAGEEVARAHKIPQAMMHFQWVSYEGAPMNTVYHDGSGRFKRGDYIELLAHDDLYLGISLCPVGDQHETQDPERFTSYPLKVQIYEGTEEPLPTFPEPERNSYKDAVDYIKEGRPDMGIGIIGDSNSFGSFDYQERLAQAGGS